VTATLHIHRPNHATTTIALKSRVDTSVEANWLRHGGILPNALCTLIAEAAPAT
jgi:aconitase A